MTIRKGGTTDTVLLRKRRVTWRREPSSRAARPAKGALASASSSGTSTYSMIKLDPSVGAPLQLSAVRAVRRAPRDPLQDCPVSSRDQAENMCANEARAWRGQSRFGPLVESIFGMLRRDARAARTDRNRVLPTAFYSLFYGGARLAVVARAFEPLLVEAARLLCMAVRARSRCRRPSNGRSPIRA